MAKKSARDLQDDEITRFLRFSVPESAAATYTQQSFDTQLSIVVGVIWLIHWIEFHMYASQIDDPAQDAAENILCQITRESKTGALSADDADLIARCRLEKDRAATIGTEAGPSIIVSKAPIVQIFHPPLPYAAQKIHIGVLSTSTAVQTVAGRIAYSMRKVSERFFFRVAGALIN